MRIISISTLQEYLTRQKYRPAKAALQAWVSVAKAARWSNHHDMKQVFPGADSKPSGPVVFNIMNNNFRLVAYIVYEFETIYIKWFGTHAEYDKIDVDTVGGI